MPNSEFRANVFSSLLLLGKEWIARNIIVQVGNRRGLATHE